MSLVASPDPDSRWLSWLVVAAVLGGTLAVLVRLAALQAVVPGQARLDAVSKEVASAFSRNESLRVDVAELASPARVTGEAQRLGLVPGELTYAAPGPEADAPRRPGGGGGTARPDGATRPPAPPGGGAPR